MRDWLSSQHFLAPVKHLSHASVLLLMLLLQLLVELLRHSSISFL